MKNLSTLIIFKNCFQQYLGNVKESQIWEKKNPLKISDLFKDGIKDFDQEKLNAGSESEM